MIFFNSQHFLQACNSPLKDIDGVWQNLFPIEQQKIIQTLIRTVLVGTEGVDVRINQEGLHSLVLEMQDEVMA